MGGLAIFDLHVRSHRNWPFCLKHDYANHCRSFSRNATGMHERTNILTKCFQINLVSNVLNLQPEFFKALKINKCKCRITIT